VTLRRIRRLAIGQFLNKEDGDQCKSPWTLGGLTAFWEHMTRDLVVRDDGLQLVAMRRYGLPVGTSHERHGKSPRE
jgi:hypothetical protein